VDPESIPKLFPAIIEGTLALKLLGPSADYLGQELQSWTEKRLTNLRRIFENAESKLGDRIINKGTVHPKVLKEILEDGSFADDELATEYFGGVLASSRTPNLRDDRGVGFAKLVDGMTSYQTRSHFFFYSAIRTAYLGAGSKIREQELFIPDEAYKSALDFSADEDFDELEQHSLAGLKSLALISLFSVSGSKARLKELGYNVPGSGLLIGPSNRGIELFLWAHGLGQLGIEALLDPATEFKSNVMLPRVEGIVLALNYKEDSSP